MRPKMGEAGSERKYGLPCGKGSGDVGGRRRTFGEVDLRIGTSKE